MNLRDEIATYTFGFLAGTNEEMSHPELSRASERMTDRIIALFCEALTNDQTVEAVHQHTALWKLTHRDAREVITFTLNAALGDR